MSLEEGIKVFKWLTLLFDMMSLGHDYYEGMHVPRGWNRLIDGIGVRHSCTFDELK
jgi:hypothetical protein